MILHFLSVSLLFSLFELVWTNNRLGAQERDCTDRFATRQLRQRHETLHLSNAKETACIQLCDSPEPGENMVVEVAKTVSPAVTIPPPPLYRKRHPCRPPTNMQSSSQPRVLPEMGQNCAAYGKRLVCTLKDAHLYFNCDHIFRTAFGEPFSLLCRLEQLVKAAKNQVGPSGQPVSDRHVEHVPYNPNRRLLPAPPPLRRIPTAMLHRRAGFFPDKEEEPPLKRMSVTPPDSVAHSVHQDSAGVDVKTCAGTSRRKSTVKPVRIANSLTMDQGREPSQANFSGRKIAPIPQKSNYTIKTEPLYEEATKTKLEQAEPEPPIKKERTPAKYLPRDIQDMLYEELHKYGPYQATNYANLREMTGLYGREITTWFDSRRRAFRTRGLIPDDVDRGGYSTEKANAAFLDAYNRGECMCIGKGCFMELKRSRF